MAVFIENGYITVTGAQGMDITVINVRGHSVYKTKGIGCQQKVFAGAKGMYIVKVGGKTFPVSLR